MPALKNSDITSSNSYTERFKCNANEVIQFKFLREVSEMRKEDGFFNPEYTHQLYGESETIFGYTGLKIQLFYTADKLISYLNMDYEEMVDAKRSGGIKPDEPLKPILENVPADGFFTNSDEFEKQAKLQEEFKPVGEMVNRFTVEDRAGDGGSVSYEVYRGDVTTPGLTDYHKRVEPFVLWFIDGASAIDADDDRWTFYFLFQTYKDGAARTKYAIAGFSTIYNYYAYPSGTRPRISQMLVFPQFQGAGLGARLLQTMYDDVIANGKDVLDITVEDPIEEFQRLRDFLDCTNCAKLDAFRAETLRGGFTEAMVAEAREKLRLNKRQARRVYEILRLKATNLSDEREYRAYRVEVKRRLNLPYQKKETIEKRLRKYLSEEEIKDTMGPSDPKEKQQQLEGLYQEEMENYKKVVHRLNNRI